VSVSQSTTTPALQSQFNIHTVLVALRRWWRIAVPMSVLLAAGAVAAVYLLHKPIYTADAWLLLTERPSILDPKARPESQRFIQNQMEFIRSERLLGPLASKPAILSTPELVGKEDVVRELAKRISIKPRGQSEIYVISFSSQSPEKAELVVREVVNAYLTFNTRLESEQDARIIRLLEEQRAARYEEMIQLREVVRTLSIDLTGVDPYRAGAEEADKPATNPLAELQDEKIRLEIDQDILALRIKLEEERQANEDYQPTDREIDALVESQESYIQLQARIRALQKKEADFKRVAKNPEENAYYKQLQAELQALVAEVEPLRNHLREGIAETLARNQARSRLQVLAELKQQYALGKARLDVLNQKFEQGMASAKKFTGDTLELEFRKAKLEQVTKTHDQISERILAITTEQRAPSRVDLFKEPSRPVQPDTLIPIKMAGFAGGIAFVVPLALAVAWEHLFRRVSTRKQLEENQLTVIGEVTALPSRQRGKGFRRRSSERGVLLFEESVDSLRTYLSLGESLDGIRSLAITSAVSGEGKTSLACQLAVSIARATGEPTLLIDGDMRSPDLHEVFGVELSPGLAEVMSDECPLEEAIETGFNDTLHILTAGRLRKNPHRLLGRGEFKSLLKKLGETYRHIVIDTPPVLPASESLVLARSADAAVLCMRRDYTRMSQAQDAQARMVASGVRVVGVVLNGIPIQQYAYKYGSYLYTGTPDAV
jgi:succinoglycan biosynthesis transport protein ExoP